MQKYTQRLTNILFNLFEFFNDILEDANMSEHPVLY